MGILSELHERWYGRPLPPPATPMPFQSGGCPGPTSTLIGSTETVLVQQDLTGTGGKLLLTGGIQMAYQAAQGPLSVKLRLYRDGQLLAESLPHQVNSFCPAASIVLAAADPIGIGRYTYTLRAVVVEGALTYAWRPWLMWAEGRS